MRTGSEPGRRWRGWASRLLLTAAAALAVETAARAQVPQPIVPSVAQRSGVVYRSGPVQPRLPQDADRDSFQGTRYEDEHDDWPFKLHPRNSCKDGGMYGRPLCPDCTAAYYPFFPGSPGTTIGPQCKNGHPVVGRWVGNIVHPFKPVGMYYDRGVHVPIYDLDYAVPGPGPFPWSHFFKRPTGG